MLPVSTRTQVSESNGTLGFPRVFTLYSLSLLLRRHIIAVSERIPGVGEEVELQRPFEVRAELRKPPYQFYSGGMFINRLPLDASCLMLGFGSISGKTEKAVFRFGETSGGGGGGGGLTHDRKRKNE